MVGDPPSRPTERRKETRQINLMEPETPTGFSYLNRL
jgi:hypothetical protein